MCNWIGKRIGTSDHLPRGSLRVNQINRHPHSCSGPSCSALTYTAYRADTNRNWVSVDVDTHTKPFLSQSKVTREMHFSKPISHCRTLLSVHTWPLSSTMVRGWTKASQSTTVTSSSRTRVRSWLEARNTGRLKVVGGADKEIKLYY